MRHSDRSSGCGLWRGHTATVSIHLQMPSSTAWRRHIAKVAAGIGICSVEWLRGVHVVANENQACVDARFFLDCGFGRILA